MYTDNFLLTMLNHSNKKEREHFFDGLDCSHCPRDGGCDGGKDCGELVREYLQEKGLLSAETGEPTVEPTPETNEPTIEENEPAAANAELDFWDNTDPLDVYIKKAKMRTQKIYDAIVEGIERGIKADIFNHAQRGEFIIRTCVQGYKQMCVIERIFDKYNIKYTKFENGTAPSLGGWYHYEFDLTEQG